MCWPLANIRPISKQDWLLRGRFKIAQKKMLTWLIWIETWKLKRKCGLATLMWHAIRGSCMYLPHDNHWCTGHIPFQDWGWFKMYKEVLIDSRSGMWHFYLGAWGAPSWAFQVCHAYHADPSNHSYYAMLVILIILAMLIMSTLTMPCWSFYHAYHTDLSDYTCHADCAMLILKIMFTMVTMPFFFELCFHTYHAVLIMLSMPTMQCFKLCLPWLLTIPC